MATKTPAMKVKDSIESLLLTSKEVILSKKGQVNQGNKSLYDRRCWFRIRTEKWLIRRNKAPAIEGG